MINLDRAYNGLVLRLGLTIFLLALRFSGYRQLPQMIDGLFPSIKKRLERALHFERLSRKQKKLAPLGLLRQSPVMVAIANSLRERIPEELWETTMRLGKPFARRMLSLGKLEPDDPLIFHLLNSQTPIGDGLVPLAVNEKTCSTFQLAERQPISKGEESFVAKSRPGDLMSVTKPQGTWSVEDNCLVSHTGLVVSGGKIMPSEGALAENWYHLSGIENQLLRLPDKNLFVVTKPFIGEPQFELSEAILLTSRANQNWYHWMIESLPRVLDIPIEIPESVPVIISSSVPQQGKDLLSNLTTRAVFEIDSLHLESHFASIKKLHLRPPAIESRDSLFSSSPRLVLNVDLELLEVFRRRVLASTTVDKEKGLWPRKIFLPREGGRKPINQGRLLKIAEEAGFEVFYPEFMRWQDQVALMRSAEEVVGTGGASMANYLFLSEGSRVLQISNPVFGDLDLLKVLCSVSRANLINFPGDFPLIRPIDPVRDAHSNFIVNEREFRKKLGC